MPEGFASIDDLKVEITASTDKLEAGLGNARAMIDKFSADGTSSLAKFDGGLAKAGQTVEVFRTGITAMTGQIGLAIQALNTALEWAEKWAKIGGLEKEFNQLKKSIDGVGSSVTIGFTEPLIAMATAGQQSSAQIESNAKKAEKGVTEMFSAAYDAGRYSKEEMAAWDFTVRATGESAINAAGSVNVLTASMGRASEASRDLQKPFGTGRTEGFMGGLTDFFRMTSSALEVFAADAKKSKQALEGDLNFAIEKFNGIRERLEDMRTGQFNLDNIIFGGDESALIKSLIEVGDRVERIKAEIKSRPVANEGDFNAQLEALDTEIEKIEQKTRLVGLAAGEAARLVAEERILAALGYEMAELSEREQKLLNDYLDSVKDSTDALAAQQALKKVTDSIDALEREAAATEHRAKMIGKTAAEVAALTAEFRILQEAERTNVDIEDELADKLAANVEKVRVATAAVKAGEAVLATNRAIDAIADQVSALELQIEMHGQSAGAIAAATTEQRLWNEATKNGVTMSDAMADKLQDLAIREGELRDQKAAMDRTSGFARDLTAAEKEAQAVERKIAALYLEAGAAAELTMQIKLRDAAERAHVTLTDEQIVRIDMLAKRYGEATRAAKEHEAAMSSIREAGQIMARTLDNAFATWTKGGKLNFRDMTESMLRDMAKLAFQMAVIRPLFGGGASGSGLIGNALGQLLGGLNGAGGVGSWQTSVVPAMASGGTMSEGIATLVGERGPELVIPRGGERVIPNHMLGGASPSVTVNIQTPPGTTASSAGSRTNADGSMTMDILIEHIDSALAQRVSEGSSVTGNAVSQRFGLSAAAGAR